MPFIVFFLLYLVLLAACRHLWPSGILFYQGVALALAVAVAHGLHAFAKAGHTTPVKDALITLLLAYAFMFTVPTTVDRSYSVRMLQLLASSPEGMSREALRGHFAEHFVRQGGVDRRIAEQQATGSLALQGEQVRLTERGRWLARLFDWSCSAFACHPN